MAFKKGASGNPGGKPKGFKNMAAYIRRETRNGKELADFAISVMRNDAKCYTHAHQWDAMRWLADRALGRAREIVEMHMGEDTDGSEDFSAVETEALEQLNSDIKRLLKAPKADA